MNLKLYAVRYNNFGERVTHQALREEFQSMVDGFTEYAARGHWREERASGTHWYNETVIVYEFALDRHPNGAFIAAALVKALQAFGERHDQRAVFYVLNGESFTHHLEG